MFDWGWLQNNLGEVGGLLGVHAVLSLLPIVAGIVLALPIGYLLHRTRVAGNGLLLLLGLVGAIPVLALFVAMPVFLDTESVDPANIVVALTIYTVVLLVRSVVDGLRSVPEPVKQSASAVGYGAFRRLVRIELPLAMPVVFAGLRAAAVSTIALVTISVLIGQPSLGTLFDQGFKQDLLTPIVVGLVLCVVLALLADTIIRLVQRGTLPWRRAVRG